MIPMHAWVPIFLSPPTSCYLAGGNAHLPSSLWPVGKWRLLFRCLLRGALLVQQDGGLSAVEVSPNDNNHSCPTVTTAVLCQLCWLQHWSKDMIRNRSQVNVIDQYCTLALYGNAHVLHSYSKDCVTVTTQVVVRMDKAGIDTHLYVCFVRCNRWDSPKVSLNTSLLRLWLSVRNSRG